MDATSPQPDPLARLAAALETLSHSQLALAEAAERLARATDGVPRERLTGAAATTRRAARAAMATSAQVAAAPPLPGPR
jgi:hypothetical protein